MPDLPEGTINAFIQNKNLAKYGLLKDNEGGFLAENFVVRYRVIFTSLRFRGGLARAIDAATARWWGRETRIEFTPSMPHRTTN